MDTQFQNNQISFTANEQKLPTMQIFLNFHIKQTAVECKLSQYDPAKTRNQCRIVKLQFFSKLTYDHAP